MKKWAYYQALKERKILVRHMRFRDVGWAAEGLVTGLRISIGTDAEIDTLLHALGEIMQEGFEQNTQF